MKTKGKGAIWDSYDIRDFHFKAPGSVLGMGGEQFDWSKGFDIEEKIGRKLITKDQNGSYSCGGTAWAYYGEAIEASVTGTYEERSSRWIYSHTFAPGGGSHGRDNCDHCIKKGWALEKLVPSYNNGKPPTEAFATKKPVITNAIIEDTEVNKALSYLEVAPNIDLMALAVQKNNGLVLAVYGEDNGTWRSAFPKPPVNRVWAHWLYVGKAKMIKGKKYLGVKNSWGDVGEDGWQWIGEDYFKTNNVWYGWTLAWDYAAPKRKLLLIEIVRLYKEIIAILSMRKG